MFLSRSIDPVVIGAAIRPTIGTATDDGTQYWAEYWVHNLAYAQDKATDASVLWKPNGYNQRGQAENPSQGGINIGVSR